MAWPTARSKTATAGGGWNHTDMNALQDLFLRAAGIAADDLAEATVTDILGLTTTAAGHGGAQVRRGSLYIATEEARTNTAYGTLTTPDQVVGVVMPSPGFMVVLYRLQIKSATNGAGRCSLFLGANEVVTANGGSMEAQAGGGDNVYLPMTTGSGGMAIGSSLGTEVTTGQLVGTGNGGGACYIGAAAGTYTVSAQFKASTGSVTAKERRLWVWTVGF